MKRFLRAAGLLSASAVISLSCSAIGALPTPIGVHPPGGTFEAPTPTPAKESFDTSPYGPAEFWGNAVPGGDLVYHFDSLAAMTRQADAVVVGQVTAVRQDLARYQSLGDLQGATWATLTFSIEQVVKGSVNEAAPKEMNLAIFMADARQYERFATAPPAGRVMVFVANERLDADRFKQPHLPDDALYYVLLDDQSVFREVGGVAVPAVDSGGFLTALKGEPFDQVIAQVKTASQ